MASGKTWRKSLTACGEVAKKKEKEVLSLNKLIFDLCEASTQEMPECPRHVSMPFAEFSVWGHLPLWPGTLLAAANERHGRLLWRNELHAGRWRCREKVPQNDANPHARTCHPLFAHAHYSTRHMGANERQKEKEIQWAQLTKKRPWNGFLMKWVVSRRTTAWRSWGLLHSKGISCDEQLVGKNEQVKVSQRILISVSFVCERWRGKFFYFPAHWKLCQDAQSTVGCHVTETQEQRKILCNRWNSFLNIVDLFSQRVSLSLRHTQTDWGRDGRTDRQTDRELVS